MPKLITDAYGFKSMLVWGCSDLSYLHLLACRIQNAGRSTTIQKLSEGRYQLFMSLKPEELVNGQPKETNPYRLLGVVDEQGYSTRGWDVLWSPYPATPQEEAWAEAKPLFNE